METLPDCNCPSLFPSGCFPILLPLLQLMGFSFFPRDSVTFVKKIVEKIRAERDGGSHQVALNLHIHVIFQVFLNHQATQAQLDQKMDANYLSFLSFRNSIFFSI